MGFYNRISFFKQILMVYTFSQICLELELLPQTCFPLLRAVGFGWGIPFEALQDFALGSRKGPANGAWEEVGELPFYMLRDSSMFCSGKFYRSHNCMSLANLWFCFMSSFSVVGGSGSSNLYLPSPMPFAVCLTFMMCDIFLSEEKNETIFKEITNQNWLLFFLTY